jgi:hypothetical protein
MAGGGSDAGATRFRAAAANVETAAGVERRYGSVRGKSSGGHNPRSVTGMK